MSLWRSGILFSVFAYNGCVKNNKSIAKVHHAFRHHFNVGRLCAVHNRKTIMRYVNSFQTAGTVNLKKNTWPQTYFNNSQECGEGTSGCSKSMTFSAQTSLGFSNCSFSIRCIISVQNLNMHSLFEFNGEMLLFMSGKAYFHLDVHWSPKVTWLGGMRLFPLVISEVTSL